MTLQKPTCSYIALGSPFILLSSAFGSIIRSEGAAKSAMLGNMIGTITNIILDPILIISMHMGIAGAAIATVIGNIAATSYYLLYFANAKTALSIRLRDFRMKNRIAYEILSIGIPTALSSLLTSLATIMMNRLVAGYGDSAVAAMGVAIKVNTLMIFIVMGLCSGVQPILAFNYGAGNHKRLMDVFRFTAIVSVMIGGALTISLLAFREQTIRLFINDDVVVEYSAKMFGILQLSCPVIGLMFLGINTLQAFGKAVQSLLLSVCRQGVIYIPLLFVFNHIWGLYGAIYAQPVTDFITIVIVLAICVHTFAELRSKSGFYLH